MANNLNAPIRLLSFTTLSPWSGVVEGAMAAPIEISEYDPIWQDRFNELRAKFEPLMGSPVTRIEHIGSTSVPGLAAKPIIDLVLVIALWASFEDVKSRLEGFGYAHEGDKGIPEREAFKMPPGCFPHHLYVCNEDSVELGRQLTFRNRLREQTGIRAEYAELKKSLAEKFRHDRAAYTDAKTEFIERQLQLALKSNSAG